MAVSAALTFGFKQHRWFAIIGGSVFGLAAAIKVLPMALLGVQSGRQRLGLFVVAALVSSGIATAAGLAILDAEPSAAVAAMAGNNAPSTEGYAWSLFYGRGLLQSSTFILVELRGFSGMQAMVAPVASILPFLGYPVLLALLGCSFLVPGRMWMRYTSVASGMVLFANAAVLYRVSVLSIALLLWVASSSQVDWRRESVTGVLFALALSPYAFGSLATPLGFAASSDTVYGTAGLLALFLYVTWRWLRGGAKVFVALRFLRWPPEKRFRRSR